jgi:tetratricopeptide (TPR) repeat protein/predicted Ser/Thr protein kinase
MSESPRHDSNFESAQHPASPNDLTVAASPDAAPDAAVQSAAEDDATIQAPSDASHEAALASDSFNDATIDAPRYAAQEAVLPSDPFNENTVDAPPDLPFATSCLPIDSQFTRMKGIMDFESEEDLSELPDGSQRGDSKPKARVANYEVLGVLGRGAVGVVYKARQLGLNRVVALKMLLAGSHAGQRELMRFRIEAEAVARLRHPNIVQVYEVGEHDGLPFFSLEFIEGGSLHQKMDGKPLPPRDAAKILETLARAMHYAHEHNIIHRDLKPANVLLTSDGIPKITDFGLAKRLEQKEDSSKTRTGTLMGTPSYMSPEQAAGRTRDIGPLSDQYTLGAILYEMLTGRPPFLGATMLETIIQVRTREPVPPTQLQATTPHDLEIICLKCLQKEPGKRYGNAGELADDLRRFLNGEPIRARPVTLWERSWRWCRRNPRIAALYAAVCVLVMLLVVSGSGLTLRLLREKQAVTRIGDQAEERMVQAAAAIFGGDVQRAKILLDWSDPLWESASDLNEQRGRWHKLNDSVEVYEEFKDLLDKARFAYVYGGGSSSKEKDKEKEQAREHCRKLLALYDAIEQERIHLPPLNFEQKQLFKDDVFDMFLVASLLEGDLVQKAKPAQRRQVYEQALDWLDRADKILPGLRTLYTHRSFFHASLGHRKEAEGDFERARTTQPRYANDHFWHGYAEHVRGDGASRRGEADQASKHYRLEIAEYAALLEQHPNHFWGYFNWANAKLQLGDLEDALIGFTNCIRLRPDFSWPYRSRGTAHLRLRQYDEAIRDYSTALEFSPKYLDARAERSMVFIEKGNIDLALQECNQVLEEAPWHAPAYLHRAECYRRRKQFEEALADCTHALELNEYKDDVHQKREAIYEEMKRSGDLQRYKRAKAQDLQTAQELYKKALQHISHGEYQQAGANFTATIELCPDAAQLYRDRGLLYWKYLKDFDAALIDWRKVTDLLPNNAEAYRFLGTVHMGRRQYDLALQDLQNALARNPNYPEVIHAKAEIYLWQGKAEDALEVINPLAEKLPAGYESTLGIRGDIYFRLGRLDAAAADYRRLIQLQPKNTEAYFSLALVCCKQGEPDKARQCLDQLVEANPKSSVACFQRGRFLRDQGQFDEAWKDSEQAARSDPKSLLPSLLQASITAGRGDPAAAVAAAERTLSEAPKDNGKVLYAAAQVYGLAAAAKESNPDLARRYADRAAELLERTLDKGFHDLDYPQHNHMIDDPALESIRQHLQARDLLAHRPQ